MKQLGEYFIDSLKFAREGRRLAGEVRVGCLQRLADFLADDDGALAWKVRGECDAEGKPFLMIEVSGGLHLRCQRCLAALDFEVNLKSHLQLVAAGQNWPDEALEDDRSDPIEAREEQPLLPLVEDEVLLALPIAPRHESCALPGYNQNTAAASPFAALAQLKKH
ncbi:MAG: YceD family protein [Proteobacteria bacterium]|nr:YceD family protein [Pseudomonadota bacterium]